MDFNFVFESGVISCNKRNLCVLGKFYEEFWNSSDYKLNSAEEFEAYRAMVDFLSEQKFPSDRKTFMSVKKLLFEWGCHQSVKNDFANCSMMTKISINNKIYNVKMNNLAFRSTAFYEFLCTYEVFSVEVQSIEQSAIDSLIDYINNGTEISSIHSDYEKLCRKLKIEFFADYKSPFEELNHLLCDEKETIDIEEKISKDLKKYISQKEFAELPIHIIIRIFQNAHCQIIDEKTLGEFIMKLTNEKGIIAFRLFELNKIFTYSMLTKFISDNNCSNQNIIFLALRDLFSSVCNENKEFRNEIMTLKSQNQETDIFTAAGMYPSSLQSFLSKENSVDVIGTVFLIFLRFLFFYWTNSSPLCMLSF